MYKSFGNALFISISVSINLGDVGGVSENRHIIHIFSFNTLSIIIELHFLHIFFDVNHENIIPINDKICLNKSNI